MPSVEGNCKRGPLDGHGRISWSDKDKIGTWLVNLDLGRLLRHLLGNSKRMQVDSELNFWIDNCLLPCICPGLVYHVEIIP